MSGRGSDFAWTRRVVLALVVVLMSLAGHAAGSSMLPDWSGLLVATMLTLALSLSVGPNASAARLFGFVLGVEALLHVVFVLTSSCHPAMSTPESLFPSTVSVIGHVVAAVAAVAVLRHGDKVLLSWSALLGAAFGAPELAVAAIPGKSVLAAPVWNANSYGADYLLSSLARRGPPSA